MEPKDFGRVILRRKRTVITAVAVVMAASLVGSLRQAPSYVATCGVLFQAVAYDPTDPVRRGIETVGNLHDNARILQGPLIAARVARALKLPASASVPGKVAVVVPETGEQSFLDLHVVDRPRPDGAGEPLLKPGDHGARAGTICNAYAEAFVAYKRDEARRTLREQLRQIEAARVETQKDYVTIQRKIKQARERGEDDYEHISQRDTIVFELREHDKAIIQNRNLLKSEINGGGKLVERSMGGARRGADPKRNGVLGLIVGLMFGIGIALVREYFDDTMRDKESTQRELGMPVLAALPAAEGFDGLDETASRTAEAARTLRATLSSMGVPHERSVLLVTSTMTKRRPTTIVGLAAAFAEAGRSVLVIGSDLRSARTHEAFGIANTVGLANVVRGQTPFERAIRPAPGLDGVYVMPCGPIIGNPGELLASEEMALVLRRARRWADVVLLDAPPVLEAADSSILGAYADGVLMVVSAGQTNRGQANEAKEQMVAAGAHILGAVLVGVEDAVQRGAGHGDLVDELPSVVPYGTWGALDDGSYASYYEDESFTMTARMAPRAGARRGAPKKVSAASVKAGSGRKRSANAAVRSPKAAARRRTTGRGSSASRSGAARSGGTKGRGVASSARAGSARRVR